MPGKVLLLYPPLRNTYSRSLPQGCLLIADAFKKNGLQVKILNMDTDRPSREEIVEQVRTYKPDIIGYSAVTSTTYSYIKDLTKHIKNEIGRDIYFIIGGNAAISADLLINKCGIDLCFIGEAYNTVQHFCATYDYSLKKVDTNRLNGIKGLIFKGEDGDLVFTGYPEQADLNDIPMIRDFSLIDINKYLWDVRRELEINPNYPPLSRAIMERLPVGSKAMMVSVNSGCQNACSFCHRNVMGIRQRKIESVLDYIDYLTKSFNVRFFVFDDESFFWRREWLEGFLNGVRKRDVAFRLAGVRADAMVRNKDILPHLVKAGMVEIGLGIEAGSQQILDTMDKNVTVAENLEAIKVANDLGIYHCPQLVLGMPGESPATLRETESLLLKCRSSNGDASINMLQVLPGSPVYWYAHKNGLIKDEEAYLTEQSDKNASNYVAALNMISYPKDILSLARRRMYAKMQWVNGSKLKSIKYWMVYVAVMVRSMIGYSDSASLRKKISVLLYILTGSTFKTSTDGYGGGSLRKLMIKDTCSYSNVVDKVKFGIR